jgi:hypothetical protein
VAGAESRGRELQITACSQNLGQYECSMQTSGTREPLCKIGRRNAAPSWRGYSRLAFGSVDLILLLGVENAYKSKS